MLEAVRPSTGAYLRVMVQGNNLFLFAKGDEGQMVNTVRTYDDINGALLELQSIHDQAVFHGLQIYNYAVVTVIGT